MIDINRIQWANHKSMITPDISVGETLMLKSWNVHHIPSDQEKKNIVHLAEILQNISDRLSLQPMIHCWIRPISANCPGTKYHGKNYNAYVGSKANSSLHIPGRAVDFHMNGYLGTKKCNEIRSKILPMLEEFNIRMEDNNGNWIHIDTGIVISKRYFKP